MQSKEHDYKVFSEMPKAYQCAVCGISHLKRRRPIKVKPLQKYVSKLINREIQDDSRVNAELCTRKMSSIYPRCRKELHNIIIVLDGTYIYIQKSADYVFQRMQIDVTHTLINICVCACMHYNVL